MSAQTVTLIALALLAIAGFVVTITGWMHVSRMRAEAGDDVPADGHPEGTGDTSEDSGEDSGEDAGGDAVTEGS